LPSASSLPTVRLFLSSPPPRTWRLLATGEPDGLFAEAERLLPEEATDSLLSVEVLCDGIVSDALVVSADPDGLTAALLALAA